MRRCPHCGENLPPVIEAVPNRVQEAYRRGGAEHLKVLRAEVQRLQAALAEVGERRARDRAPSGGTGAGVYPARPKRA